MPWVRFVSDFDWHVRPNVTVYFRANHHYLVTQRCANEAVTEGKAVAIEQQTRVDVDASR